MPNYLADVRKQYEDYPYPLRNPANEVNDLLAPATDFMCALNHYCFEGKKDFNKEFNVLVAGAGTGDSVILWGEQLRNTPNKVVYLDISQNSMNIAKERARIRGLTNIIWLHGSLLDLPKMDIGKFDYINCSGVLHHLQSPDEGLKALCSVLKEDGAIKMMVYGKHARTGVYQMQELMRIANKGITNAQDKVNNCKSILASLPDYNILKRTGALFTDPNVQGDIGVYDLFLHSQDRAYSVPELYDFVKEAKLNLVQLYNETCFSSYQPEAYIVDPTILARLKKLSLKERQTAAELLSGAMIKHTFYTSVKKDSVANHEDETMIPVLNSFFNRSIYQDIRDIIERCQTEVEIKHGDFRSISFAKTPATTSFFKHLDGQKSIAEIRRACKKEGVTHKEFDVAFSTIRYAMGHYHWLFLRHPSVPDYPVLKELHDQMKQEKAA